MLLSFNHGCCGLQQGKVAIPANRRQWRVLYGLLWRITVIVLVMMTILPGCYWLVSLPNIMLMLGIKSLFSALNLTIVNDMDLRFTRNAKFSTNKVVGTI
jgi:hypothetical protein